MKKLDVVVVGELNVDLILDQIQGFPELGKEKIATAMTLTLGSSSAIFASNLSSLGARVGFIGKLGEDVFGDLVLASLQKRSVDIGQIIVQGATGTGATVAMNYDHQRAMLTYKGAMDELRLAEVRWDYVQTARHLHLSSYFLQSGIKPDCAALFKRAKDLGLSTSLDTNWDPDERWGPELYEIFPYVDVFLPNEDEAMLIATCKTVEAALDKLAQHVKTVVIKLGKSGALAKQQGKTYKSDGFKVAAVDAVGAGDSFDAGFIFKWLQGGDLNQCLHFGNMCGALSVTKAGGTAAFQSRKQIAQDFENYFGYKEK